MNRAEQAAPNRCLVDQQRLWVTPLLNPPDPAIEICRLTGKEAEENLRWTPFDPHGRQIPSVMGALSSTSRSDLMTLPLGESSFGHRTDVAGSRNTVKYVRSQPIKSSRAH